MNKYVEKTNDIHNIYCNIHDMHHFQEKNVKAISYNDFVKIHVLSFTTSTSAYNTLQDI